MYKGRSHIKINMVVSSASGVKACATMGTFPFFKIVANRHRFSAFATVNRVRAKLTLWPRFNLMPH